MKYSDLFILRKNCALWQVISKASGKVVFSSLSKANCNDWLDANDQSENED